MIGACSREGFVPAGTVAKQKVRGLLYRQSGTTAQRRVEREGRAFVFHSRRPNVPRRAAVEIASVESDGTLIFGQTTRPEGRATSRRCFWSAFDDKKASCPSTFAG
jgi:hypothetical protein